jgi:uroporphyrinogen-III synthase
MSTELAAMVVRFGGVPYPVPAVRETPLEQPEDVAAFIDALCAGRFAIVVLMTGVGVAALLREAERLGRLDAVLAALRKTITVCRGPKPVAVLRRHEVPVSITAAEPHTTAELLRALEPVDVAGRTVGFLHYGERNETAADGLRERGARVSEVCLYEWRLPDDVAALEGLVGEIINGRVDALVITSQIQCRHLFQIAGALGKTSELTEALNARVVVAAVGPVCAAALRSVGVIPHVQPAHPKMGPMMIALADYYELTDRRVQ